MYLDGKRLPKKGGGEFLMKGEVPLSFKSIATRSAA